MDCLHLFNGIGGFALAAAMVGWNNVAHCEIDEFCNRVMAKHFPQSVVYGNIDESDFTIWRGRIDIITGGFPCQPFSGAGSQLGMQDPRYKWPAMYRAVCEVQPPWVVAENVPGFVTWRKGMAFEKLHLDLESAGYETTSFLIPAAGVDAPHRRERLWIVAYADCFRKQRITSPQNQHTTAGGETCNIPGRISEEWIAAHAGGQCAPGFGEAGNHPKGWEEPGRQLATLACGTWGNGLPDIPPVCRVDDGLSDWVDQITALGNAIVPQVAAEIFSVIDQFEKFTQ